MLPLHYIPLDGLILKRLIDAVFESFRQRRVKEAFVQSLWLAHINPSSSFLTIKSTTCRRTLHSQADGRGRDSYPRPPPPLPWGRIWQTYPHGIHSDITPMYIFSNCLPNRKTRTTLSHIPSPYFAAGPHFLQYPSSPTPVSSHELIHNPIS